ncbi:hypothetical protein FIM25_11655 [Desulfobotulus mexicanus]|uniref:Uncharacterized protein n=1 Tax=Desulfobotulus mexicanus TaxID=2586642 RepID=A0A5S5MEB2_9BACT|nr:hypothetical protein FIM25_11655 [Desulfobotulus mexicanus]
MAQLYCKAHWLFAGDVAIVSDQSFAGLCERSGKLSEPTQRQRVQACYGNKKAYPACGGEFLPVPHRAKSFRIRLRHGQTAWVPVHLSDRYDTYKIVLNNHKK